MVKIGLFIESDDGRVTIEPKQGVDVFRPEMAADGSIVAPNMDRLMRIAACVTTCLASSARQEANTMAAEKGGAHQTPPNGNPPNPESGQQPARPGQPNPARNR